MRMKNERMNVAKLANQAKNPGTASPGAARPLDDEVVEVPALPAASRVALVAAVEVAVVEGSANPSPVRVPAVVNTKAEALVLGPKSSQMDSRRVMTGVCQDHNLPT